MWTGADATKGLPVPRHTEVSPRKDTCTCHRSTTPGSVTTKTETHGSVTNKTHQSVTGRETTGPAYPSPTPRHPTWRLKSSWVGGAAAVGAAVAVATPANVTAPWLPWEGEKRRKQTRDQVIMTTRTPVQTGSTPSAQCYWRAHRRPTSAAATVVLPLHPLIISPPIRPLNHLSLTLSLSLARSLSQLVLHKAKVIKTPKKLRLC